MVPQRFGYTTRGQVAACLKHSPFLKKNDSVLDEFGCVADYKNVSLHVQVCKRIQLIDRL